MSDQKFLVRHNGKAFGPFTIAQLRAAVAKQQLTPSHELSPDGETWLPAAKFWRHLQPDDPLTTPSAASPTASVAVVAPTTAAPATPSHAPMISVATPQVSVVAENSEPVIRLQRKAGGTVAPAPTAAEFSGNYTNELFPFVRGALFVSILFCILVPVMIGTIQMTRDASDREAWAMSLPTLGLTFLGIIGMTQLLFILWTKEAYSAVRERRGGFKLSGGLALVLFFAPLVTLYSTAVFLTDLGRAVRLPMATSSRSGDSGTIVNAWTSLRILVLLLTLTHLYLTGALVLDYRQHVANPPRTLGDERLYQNRRKQLNKRADFLIWIPPCTALCFAAMLGCEMAYVSGLQPLLRASPVRPPDADAENSGA